MLSWERFVYFFPKVIVKFPVTLEIVLISFGSGLLLGCLLAWIRIKKIPVLSQIAAVFISYIRCTPVICQMFVVYFGVPALLGQMGIDSSAIDRVVYIYIAYGLNNGGFMGRDDPFRRAGGSHGTDRSGICRRTDRVADARSHCGTAGGENISSDDGHDVHLCIPGDGAGIHGRRH